MFFFEKQEIGCDLSLMKISYILTKRTKTKKFEKYLKTYTKNFKTKGYKMTALDNIINSILSYKLRRLVSNLRLPKEQKQAKTATSRKKLSEKSIECNKK